jgi:hypothetical protein
MHEGSQYRKFEGEEKKNHHGDAPNPLFSTSQKEERKTHIGFRSVDSLFSLHILQTTMASTHFFFTF